MRRRSPIASAHQPADTETSGPRYNMRAVERLTGVPAATLRSWERRYGFPAPDRSAGARRLYSDTEITAIRWVKDQTAQGLSVSQALEQAQHGHAAMPVTTPPPAAPPPAAVTTLSAQFVDAVAAYDEAGAESVLSSAFARLSADIVLLEVLRPALVEIGERWARGELAIAAEHFGSRLVHRRLSALLNMQPPLSNASTVILACPPGEQHELGLMMLGVFLRWAALHVVYLGADVPVADLARCISALRPAAICLSAVDPRRPDAISETVTALRAAGITTPVVAGGPGSPVTPLPGVAWAPADLRDAAHLIAGIIQGTR